MTEILIMWLSTGSIISGPVTPYDCSRHIGAAVAAVASGGFAELTEDTGQQTRSTLIVRMQCGGHDVVLALPPTDGNCEVEAGS